MYVANFTKEITHDYEGFFNKPIESKEIIALRKEIQKLQSQLEESLSNLEMLKSSTGSDFYTPVNKQQILIYEGRSLMLIFDLNTGLPFDDRISDCQKVYVNKKSDDFYILTGYCYPLGAAVIKHYKYAIAQNNAKITLQTLEEILIPFFEDTGLCFVRGKETLLKMYQNFRMCDALKDVNASLFLKEFYGIDKEVDFSLEEMRKYIRSNKSFEIILRTARLEDIDCLMKIKSEKPLPVHKLLRISKEEYRILIEKEYLEDFISFRSFIEENSEEISMSASDMINFLDNCKRWKENLDFYNIPSRELEKELIRIYIGIGWDEWKDFPKYYSIGKFCNYVVTETINQGYTNIRNLTSSLRDYIKMCLGVGIKPHLYSTSLELTHNVAARNYKIALTEEQEIIFKNRYSEFEPFEYKDYVLLAPRSSEDIKSEGSSLNHCVASYIKDVLDGDTMIFFLRLKKEYKDSLVTIEIRGKALVQAKGVSNRDLNPDEEEALKAFCVSRKLMYKV